MLLSLLLGFGTVQAHQPDLSSTILSEQGKDKWVLQVRGALTGFEYEIHQNFGENSYATPEEFQELVMKHVQENISILFDESNNVVLKNGIVRLGHETNVIFEVKGVPENFKAVEFKNSSFKDISRNQSALIILKKGVTQKQFVLNNANQHTANLILKDLQLVSLNPTTKKAMVTPNLYIGIALLVILGFWIYLNNYLQRLNPKES
jgi:hypothetical protein